MSSYVQLQQAEFANEEFGYTATRHQREVGAGYFDGPRSGHGRGVLDARAQGLDRGSAVRGGARFVSTTADATVSAPDEAGVLTPEALDLVVALEREFRDRREELLLARAARQKWIEGGELPDFLESTRSIREGDWRVAPVPADLRDRRVEITGPAGDRKMVINAFNSGARIYMADFEDANSPTWANVVGGQQNLTDESSARSRSSRARRATR